MSNAYMQLVLRKTSGGVFLHVHLCVLCIIKTNVDLTDPDL